jgi:hypothetical protein
MANPIKGEVALEVDGRRYMFMLGTYALAALERRLGMPWPKIFKRASEGEWGVAEVLAVVHAGLLRHNPQITEVQVADLIDAAGLDRINEMIGEGLKLMQPEASRDESDIPENPMKPGNGHGMSSSRIG